MSADIHTTSIEAPVPTFYNYFSELLPLFRLLRREEMSRNGITLRIGT